MIQVKFSKSENGKSIILDVKGHAGKAPIGQDIVCASVSILAYTVAHAVLNMSEQGKLKKKPTVRLCSGDAVITCKPSRNFFSEALHTFSLAEIGYSLLQDKYPEFVNVQRLDETK